MESARRCGRTSPGLRGPAAQGADGPAQLSARGARLHPSCTESGARRLEGPEPLDFAQGALAQLEVYGLFAQVSSLRKQARGGSPGDTGQSDTLRLRRPCSLTRG